MIPDRLWSCESLLDTDDDELAVWGLSTGPRESMSARIKRCRSSGSLSSSDSSSSPKASAKVCSSLLCSGSLCKSRLEDGEEDRDLERKEGGGDELGSVRAFSG